MPSAVPAQYPQHFPGPVQTLMAPPFADRFYPASGTCLAVALPPAAPHVEQGVYGMGGVFGHAPLQVTGPPVGVSAGTLRVAAGSAEADLVLHAAADAPHALPTEGTVTVAAGPQGVFTASRPLTVTVRGPAGSVHTSFQGGVVATPVRPTAATTTW